MLFPSYLATRAALDFTPASYLPSDNAASLVAWYRFGIGVTQSGGFISVWADQSGNGRNLVQATGTNQPAYSAGVVTCDGVDNFMSCLSAGFGAQPYTYAALMSQVSVNTKYLIQALSDTGILYQSSPSPTIALAAGGATSPTSTQLPSDITSFSAVTCLFAGASSSLKVQNNAESTGNPGPDSMGGSLYLCSRNGTGNYANGAFKELIFRNVNDASIRAADHAYLMTL